jgi:hypothetical protein
LRQRIIEVGENRRQILGALEGDDLLQAAFHARPTGILAHQVQRFAGCRDIQHALLNGAGEVEKVSVLQDQYGIEAVLLHQNLQLLVAGNQFAGGGNTHGISS